PPSTTPFPYTTLFRSMTDALITDLAQMGSVKVISRTSIMRYKKTDKSLPEIARELNVGGIIEGTVQRSGDRVRITAQLNSRAISDRKSTRLNSVTWPS